MHFTNIYPKLAASDKASAVASALRHRLIDQREPVGLGDCNGLARRPARPTPRVVPLSAREVDQALAQYPGWRRVGKTLIRDLSTREFDEALRLVERVAQLAVDYLRRPDMCISEFNRVRLRIVNLHHSGLTEAELRLAAKTSAVIDEHNAAEAQPATHAA
ncbi:MAG: 4a-hydroxytetrahydrobiopterin dehydratase [Solirubrobacteraceae bacterium]|nr:4a-hydroxytetrahydrobiopterin dehydratase [Solirubrobacteraceae bacterium]MEA2186080.1 4a-hydroxytetrahydrobiopterin dehydratase [Solirubrobacteraceae bacterium]